MPSIAPRRLILIASASVMATMIAPATPAHHSTAMFDWGKALPMANVTVERWDWTNPHTFLYVSAPGAGGKMEKWAFEGMSPNHLGRIGWTKRTLKPGDKINLTYYKLKDGRKGGFNVSVTFPDGKTMKQLDSPTTRPDQER